MYFLPCWQTRHDEPAPSGLGGEAAVHDDELLQLVEEARMKLGELEEKIKAMTQTKMSLATKPKSQPSKLQSQPSKPKSQPSKLQSQPSKLQSQPSKLKTQPSKTKSPPRKPDPKQPPKPLSKQPPKPPSKEPPKPLSKEPPKPLSKEPPKPLSQMPSPETPPEALASARTGAAEPLSSPSSSLSELDPVMRLGMTWLWTFVTMTSNSIDDVIN